MIYLHSWLLTYHMRQNKSIDESYLEGLKVKVPVFDGLLGKMPSLVMADALHQHQILMRLLIKTEHVKLYTNMFDDAIHEELKR